MKIVRAVALALPVFFLVGAATSQRGDDENVSELKLDKERVGENGPRCPAEKDLEVIRGPVPKSARAIARLTLSTDDAVTLVLLEAAFRQAALPYCGDGVSVLRAVEQDGRVSEATAMAWTRDLETERSDG